MSTLLDRFERSLRSLRISVTDRCNLRCGYCMPEEEYTWLPREDLLHFEEIGRLAGVFAGLGVTKIRLTGGEPLLRRGLHTLVEILRGVPGIEDVALTTNGILLERWAETLRAAGLQRVTVSLDTLRPDRAPLLTGRHLLDKTLAGIAAAGRVGFDALKLNTVVIRGSNDDEMVELLEYAKSVASPTPVEVRFIEYMDVGGATRWSPEQVVSRDQILSHLEAHYGAITPVPELGSAPARRYRLPDGTVFGIIASTTQPFCRSCDRARVIADGRLFLCLYAQEGFDLRAPLRGGKSDEEIAARIRAAWSSREERGAEVRAALASDRLPLVTQSDDPHLEMHTRGG